MSHKTAERAEFLAASIWRAVIDVGPAGVLRRSKVSIEILELAEGAMTQIALIRATVPSEF
jgi:hypothetical protein